MEGTIGTSALGVRVHWNRRMRRTARIDGAVTTFAIVAAVEGAGLDHRIIVALGLASVWQLLRKAPAKAT